MVYIAAKKVKGIMFDFWGTLVENGIYPSPVRQAQMILRVRLHFNEYIERFENAFMTKDFETLTEAFHSVAQEFDVNPPGFVYDKLVGMWNKNTILSKPFDETAQNLQELKDAGYKLILMSNTDSLSVPQLLEKFKMTQYFDEVVLSCHTGLLKTNPAMFELALEKTKLKKEQVVMVGDSIPTDIEGAKKAGIRGILLDRKDRREFEDKITSLSQLKDKLA